MGHYLGLRFAAKLKPEFVDVVRALNGAAEINVLAAWDVVSLLYPAHGFLRLYAGEPRAALIPFGANTPDGWVSENELKGNVWRVCCGTKYKDTIDYFLKKVLPHMALESVFVDLKGETIVDPR